MVRFYNWVGFSLLFVLSCGNPINIQDIRSTGTFNVTSVSIVNNQLIVNGNGFQEIRGLALSDSSGFYKPFMLSSYTTKKIVGLNQEPQSISIPSALMNLIIDTADGASTIPVTFDLQDDSVETPDITDQAVTLEKLSPFDTITGNAMPGDVIIFDGGKFIFAPAASGSGTGGVDSITIGVGIFGDPGISTATNVPIAVNVGITGSSTSTYIPYFNFDNELEISNTAKLIFSNTDTDDNFAISNKNIGPLEISVEDPPGSQNFVPLISITKDGEVSITSPAPPATPSLTVGGLPVCLKDGSGCPEDLTGTVSSINAIPPIIAITTRSLGSTVTISADTGVDIGKLVQLVDATGNASGTGPGFLPAVDGSKLTNIVTKFNSRTGLVVPLAGDYTGDMVYTTPTGAISATTTQGAINELEAEKLALAGGTMTGELKTSSKEAIFIGKAAGSVSGELRFEEATGTRYLGFKAPTDILGDVIWTLPIADGLSGNVLTTNGSAVLSWASPTTAGFGNVVGPTSSTDNAIARYVDITGKIIESSLVTISDAGDLSAFGAGSFGGALSALSYSNNSDRALKKDIEPFSGAASIVDKLMPVTFRWKSGDEKPVIGLIAQDVEKVIPEVISKSNQKGKTIRSYDVGQVLILTLEALKETREELKQTKNELRAFQEKVKDLEKRIPQKN